MSRTTAMAPMTFSERAALMSTSRRFSLAAARRITRNTRRLRTNM